MVGVGTLVGRDLGRFRFVERDAGLRVQSRSLPVSESHLPIDVFGPGHPAGASSLRDRGETTSKMLLCEEPKGAKGSSLRSQLPCSMDERSKRGEGSQSSVSVSATIVNIRYINYRKRRGGRKEEKRDANGERKDNRFGKDVKECS